MKNNRITGIAGVNVKGRNFRHELEPLTILVGGNTAGKTAITDAITIALLGYLPALGKKAGATMSLAPAGAKQMEVEATLQDGRIRRTFTRTRTGASLETGGACSEVLPAQLSFSDFLSAKPTDRHAILNTLMADIDYAALGDRVKAKMATLGLMDEIEVKINATDAPLDDAIKMLGAEILQRKQAVDTARKTLATLVAEEPPTETILPARIAELEQAVAKAIESVGKTSQILDSLTDALQRAPEEPDVDPPAPEDIEIARQNFEIATEDLNTAQNAAANATLLEQQIAEAGHQANKLEMRAKALVDPDKRSKLTLADIKRTREVLEQELDGTRAKIVELARDSGVNKNEHRTLEQQIDQLGKHGTCPCCGTTGQALEAAMQAMLARQEAAEATAAECDRREQDAKTERDRINEKLAELVAAEIELDAWEATDQLAAATDKVTKLRAQKKEIDLPGAKERKLAAGRALEGLSKAAMAWQTYRAANHPKPEQIEQAERDFYSAKLERDARTCELGDARDVIARRDQAIADQQRIATMTREANETEETMKGIADLRLFLKAEQQAATAEAMKPLASIAGCLLAEIVNGELAVEGHQVGIRRGEDFLPLEVLSGMEMLATSAACQAALASQSDIPILIVDEMARMTPANRKRFADNCRAAIEQGIISQAILIDQDATSYPEGKIITCA